MKSRADLFGIPGMNDMVDGMNFNCGFEFQLPDMWTNVKQYAVWLNDLV